MSSRRAEKARELQRPASSCIFILRGQTHGGREHRQFRPPKQKTTGRRQKPRTCYRARGQGEGRNNPGKYGKERGVNEVRVHH